MKLDSLIIMYSHEMFGHKASFLSRYVNTIFPLFPALTHI